MRRPAAWLPVLILAAALAGPTTASPRNLRLADLDGTPRSSASLVGRPVVVVLWRSDCGPCLLELQGLAGLQAAAAPARLVTLSLDDTAPPARRALAKLGVTPQFAWRAWSRAARC